jgi:hypothetical protein
MTNIKSTIDRVSQHLLEDDDFVCRSVQFLFDSQTVDEKRDQRTRHANGSGFNVVDAKRFTRVVEDAIERGYLTPDEMAMFRSLDKRGRPVLAKYWRQLAPLLEELGTIEPPRRPPQPEGMPPAAEVRVS